MSTATEPTPEAAADSTAVIKPVSERTPDEQVTYAFGKICEYAWSKPLDAFAVHCCHTASRKLCREAGLVANMEHWPPVSAIQECFSNQVAAVWELHNAAVAFVENAKPWLLDQDPIKVNQRRADLMSELQRLAKDPNARFTENAIIYTTKSIMLYDPETDEDFQFGEFEIELPYTMAGYSILATDPDYASTTGHIHPHVNNGELCEGEATAAITGALERLWLTDFFTIVENTLDTYNEESPYVSLANWNATVCGDCDEATDSCIECQFCGAIQCSHCGAGYCERCEADGCSRCLTACTDCASVVCDRCSSICNSCGEPVCDNDSCSHVCTQCNERMCNNCGGFDLDCDDAPVCHECQYVVTDEGNEIKRSDAKFCHECGSWRFTEEFLPGEGMCKFCRCCD